MFILVLYLLRLYQLSGGFWAIFWWGKGIKDTRDLNGSCGGQDNSTLSC